MIAKQLGIDLGVLEQNTFANFVTHTNQDTVKCLQAICDTATEAGNIYLSGGAGSGKSHLLQAVCHYATECNRRALYLPLKQSDYNPEEVLTQAEPVQIVCVDDINTIAGNHQSEELFFNLINNLRRQKSHFIAAGLSSPKHTDYILPDLSSRLMWGGVYSLTTLSDEEKAQAIKLRMRAKGDELSDEVIKWLLFHYARDMHSLMQATHTLARESLHQNRRITVPLAKILLEEEA